MAPVPLNPYSTAIALLVLYAGENTRRAAAGRQCHPDSAGVPSRNRTQNAAENWSRARGFEG
jgi:hypothetical protein